MMMFSPGESVRVNLPNRLDGPVEPLRHRLDAGKQRKDNQQHQRDGENVETSHVSSRPDAPERGLVLSANRARRFSRLFLNR